MKKAVLITGATSGLGLSYAKYFASKGYPLIITGRREHIIRKNAEELRQEYNIEVQVILVDLSCKEGIDYLIDIISNIDIEILVNNAGFGLKTSFYHTAESDIIAMLDLQIYCVTRLTHTLLKKMIENNKGVIINISSDGAFAVMPYNVLYSSTKLYLLNLTEGLHMELANTNIKVQAVCPGFIDSHFHESAGMSVNKNKKGMLEFRNPDDIVKDAMKDLDKNVIVSVPDRGAKLIRFIGKFLPRKIFYTEATKFSNLLKDKNA